jgi:hypothetical protein
VTTPSGIQYREVDTLGPQMKARAAASTESTPTRSVADAEAVIPHNSGAAIIRLVTATRSAAMRMSTTTTAAMMARATITGPRPRRTGSEEARAIAAFCPTARLKVWSASADYVV